MTKVTGHMDNVQNTFKELILKLTQMGYSHQVIGASEYLIPTGKTVGYVDHPIGTIRCAGHWNWHGNPFHTGKPAEYILCENIDAPPAYPVNPKKSTRSRNASQIAIVGSDGKYHCLYGEIFANNDYDFKDTTVEEIIENIKSLIK
jgi:hypothetical protein